ncbi:EamA family transporter [Anaerovibrio sp.]|uniref:EamA family transporter n=1 Tax=Anaerovibrio sp. TaxID=1872532 RepID=UPI00388FD985
MTDVVWHAGIMLAAVFMATFAQVMLKKAANNCYNSILSEYLNFRVVSAYVIMILTTLMSIYALKVIPLSLGAVLDASSYVFVTFWSWYFFSENVDRYNLLGLGLILLGIGVFFSG